MDYCFKFTKKVLNFIDDNNMISEGDNIIVGLSGGGDSVCLFLILNELRKKINFNLYAVHVNHGIRGISATRDEMFAVALCERENVPCKVVKIDAVAKAKLEKITLEEAGRKARYEIFSEEAALFDEAKIAVAHHMNDQAETVLFNLARGAGLKGMGGIQAVRNNILRPLLCVTKEEIISFLSEKNEDFCIDETNDDDDYTRNYIRNKIIPALSEIQPEITAHIASTAYELREANEYIEEKSKELFDESVERVDISKDIHDNQVADIVKNGDVVEGYIIDISKIKKEKPILIRNIIIITMQRLVDEWKDVSRIHIQDVYGLIDKGKGKEIHLPKGLIAKKIKNGIFIYKVAKDCSI